MEYLIGLLVAVAVAVLATVVGFARDRSFYATVLIVVAAYYVLFAATGADRQTLWLEMAAAGVFVVLAVVGYYKSLWLLAAATVGHGVFDIFHHRLIHDPGVPAWWPGFCMAADVGLGVWLAVRLMRPAKVPPGSGSPNA